MIERFLNDHIDTAMFLLSNLEVAGMGDHHDVAMSVWVVENGSDIVGVLGRARAGHVLPCLRQGPMEAACIALHGEAISSIVGPRDQVRALEKGWKIGDVAKSLDSDETLFALDLDRLTVPDGAGHLLSSAEVDPVLIHRWFTHYGQEALNTPHDQVKLRADKRMTQFVGSDNHRVLVVDDKPVAMTAFNARIARAVQIGGVYTRPELRSRGYARRAVALHLDEARHQGVKRAILFTNGQPAMRAYQAIGFEPIGAWSLLIFNPPHIAGH